MKYINTNDKRIIETPMIISGGGWKLVEEPARKTIPRKKKEGAVDGKK